MELMGDLRPLLVAWTLFCLHTCFPVEHVGG